MAEVKRTSKSIFRETGAEFDIPFQRKVAKKLARPSAATKGMEPRISQMGTDKQKGESTD